MKTLSIYLDDETRKALQKKADLMSKETGIKISLGAMVRALLKRGLGL